MDSHNRTNPANFDISLEPLGSYKKSWFSFIVKLMLSILATMFNEEKLYDIKIREESFLETHFHVTT